MPDRPTRARQHRGPRVHIVGGGISGLVAALRLAQRGYRVIVYEERDVIGGNVGGFEKNGCCYLDPAHSGFPRGGRRPC
jgi:carotenoid phi-ring synthase / carotenoid chi-ring synthase